MNLSNKERFLLHYLRNRQVDWGIDKPVMKLFEHCGRIIQDLKYAGYLIDDDYSYFLEVMDLPKLKALLKAMSLPTSGCKAELISRIKLNTSDIQRRAICSDLYYVLSESGLLEAEKYFSETKTRNQKLKNDLLLLIKKGMFKDAVYCMCESYEKEVIPPGIDTDWSDKESIWNSQQKGLALIKNYNWADLKNTDEFKQLLIRCMFFDSLIEHNLSKTIDLFLTDTTESLYCISLSTMFEKYDYTPTEPEKWFTYLDTKRYNAHQINMRNLLGKEEYRPLPDGEFNINESTIEHWKDIQEFDELLKKDIDAFPKTFQTFQKHKQQNSDKYRTWISNF